MTRPRFRVGDTVQVLDLDKTGHVRVPVYARGKVGLIERYCGPYLNPEDLAYGRLGGPAVHLYQVAFAQTDLWPRYAGAPADKLFLEIYEHWLAPSELAA